MKQLLVKFQFSKLTPFIHNKWLILLVFSSLSLASFGQCKSFFLGVKGDTLNCIDYSGLKQGKWIIKEPSLRGNPGFEEEGEFVNDLKNGIWRRFSEQGDIQAVESYKWGLLDGKSQYYSLQGLEREESWRAIDPAKKFDTIQVPDLYDESKTYEVVVKNDGQSMKHGKWIWYDPGTGFEVKKEEYFRDSAVNSLAMFGLDGKKKNNTDSTGTAKKVEKPAVVQEWEKKNSGKKKVTVRDGSAGY